MKRLTKTAEECNLIPTASNNKAAIAESVFNESVPSSSSEEEKKKIHSFSKKLAKEIHAKKFKLNAKAKHAAHESTVVKYLAYKMRGSKHVIGGKKWFYNTLEELAKVFPYLGETTIYEIVLRLQSLGYLEIGNFNQWRRDKTVWYHVPPAVCHAAEEDLVYFDSAVAADVGVVAAVLFGNFEHWIKQAKETGLPQEVEMSPTILARLLPFSVSAIKGGLGALEGKYVQRLSKTVPLFGLPQIEIGSYPNRIGSYPNRIGSYPNRIGSYPNRIGSYPNDITHCKPITNPLESCSKGESATLPFLQTSDQDEQKHDEIISSAEGIAPFADEQDRKQMSTAKTISPFLHLVGFSKQDMKDPIISDKDNGVSPAFESDKEIVSNAVFSSPPEKEIPSAVDINGAAENVNGKWPTISSLAELNTLTRSHSSVAAFYAAEPKEKDRFLSIVNQLCSQTMGQINPALCDQWFEDQDEDVILQGLLPAFDGVMRQSGIDPGSNLFEPFYCGAMECLVGSFLWRKDAYGNYPHPMVPLLGLTHDLYLDLWDRKEEKRLDAVEAEFNQRKLEHASVDEGKEQEAELTAPEKMRVFRNGLNARNQIGWVFYDETHRTDQITRIGKPALKLVQRLFELNPRLSAADLLKIMDECTKAFSQQPAPQQRKDFKDGKPPFGVKWHARNGHDLLFFITNLHWIVQQLGMTASCPITAYLRDAKKEKALALAS